MLNKNFLFGFITLGLLFSAVLAAPSEDTTSEIIIDPVTKKIYVTTGHFQNTDDIDNSSTNEESDITETVEDSLSEENTNEESTETPREEITEPQEENTNTTPEQDDFLDDFVNERDSATETTVTDKDDDEDQSTNDSEFTEALAWMYANGLTKYNNETDYMPWNPLTREQAAKIIGQAYEVLGYSKTTKNTDCTFDDADEFDPTLSSHIKNVCNRGLFKGHEGEFFPTQELTRPQTMAVLIRMFEGELSYENQTPWWADYYKKGLAIGLTTNDNINEFEGDTTRYEVALYVYRLKNIVTNDKLHTLSKNAISKIDGGKATQVMTDNEMILENLASIAQGIDASNDPELQESINWMNDNGLTKYDEINTYQPFKVLLREEAAKMLDLFAKLFNFGNTVDGYLPSECEFNDLATADPTLQTHIENVCKMGLLKGVNGSYNPKDPINKSHFVTALIRMFEGGPLDETTTPWWKNYYEQAIGLGIVGPADSVTFDNPITRYEVALFLYRFKVKYLLLNSLNNNKLKNEVVSTVPGTTENIEGKLQANVYVDTNLLNDNDFDIGYLEMFDIRYKIVKTANESYFTDNFVWYGDVFDLENDEKVGTASFIVSNGLLVEGTIRFDNNDMNFMITGVEETTSYYNIKQVDKE